MNKYEKMNSKDLEFVFLENLERLMKENKISQKELAEAVGISPSTISTWYKRNTTSISGIHISNIADYFCIDMKKLMFDVNEELLIFSSKDFTEYELEQIKIYANSIKGSEKRLLEHLRKLNLIYGHIKPYKGE